MRRLRKSQRPSTNQPSVHRQSAAPAPESAHEAEHQRMFNLQRLVGNRAVAQGLQQAPAIQRFVEIGKGPGAGMYSTENLRVLLDSVAQIINTKYKDHLVKRGPLKMVWDDNIFMFPTLDALAQYMLAGYEQHIESRPWPPFTLAYGADHGDYHFTGKVTKKKAQWTVSKGTALGLMEAAITKYAAKLRNESAPKGWSTWYIGEDAGGIIGNTVAGTVSQFTIQFQVNVGENLISYHGYPDQRLKKTGIGKSKSSITDAEDD